MSAPRRILFILEVPVSYRSGWLAHVREHTDLDVQVLYLTKGQPDRPWEKGAGSASWVHFAKSVDLGGTKTGFFPRLSFDLSDRIGAIDPDVVIIPGWAHPATWQVVRWCRKNDRQYGVMFESWKSQGQTRVPAAVSTRIRQRVLEGAAVAMPVGERAAEFARGLGFSDVSIVHGNTCDSATIAHVTANTPALEVPTVLFVGRLMPHKGSELLERCIVELDGAGLRFQVIGDGPGRPDFESLAAQRDDLEFLGPQPTGDVLQAMAQAHVVLVPSFDEPWGVVVHEALAAGTPVVATTEVGSATDLIRSDNCGRVVPTQAEALARAVREVIAGSDATTASACRSAASLVSYATATTELAAALSTIESETGSRDRDVRPPRVVIDARTARTGGGATVLRIIEEQLVPTLSGLDVEIRRPPTSRRDVRNHPATPLTSRRHQPEIVLSLSEASNLGAGGSQRTIMMARNWNCWLPAETPRRKARAAMARRNLAHVDDVMVATEVFAETIRSFAPPATKVAVQPFGIGHQFTPDGPTADGAYFLCVGDWYPWKRFELAVEAFARVADELPEAELRIAGRPIHPDYQASTIALAAELGIADRVVALGHVDAARLASLYRGAMATVATSELETFGHPYLEALASGSPLIGRSMPVTEELVGGHAVLVDGSAASFAEAMMASPRSVDARQAALSHVAQFSWERYLAGLRQLIADGVG